MVARCAACITPWTSLGAFVCPICGTTVRLSNGDGVRTIPVPERPAPQMLVRPAAQNSPSTQSAKQAA